MENQQTEFAKLFEESLATKELKEGEIVTGHIVKISKDFVMVDVGFKSEGQIQLSEFKDFNGELTAKEGDDVDVQVVVVENDNGMMILSKERADVMRIWDKLVDVADKDEIIEGRVISKVKGGLCVDIGVKAFLPGSQADIRPIRNLDKFVGNVYEFKIVKMNKKRGNVVVSRKAILEKEREGMKAKTLETISEGQILDGAVKNVTEYGVFVDLGGVDGLLHVTDMSWGRVNHPSELFQVGDDIRVKVLKYDDKTGRVSLGYKQLQSDPWEGVEGKYPVGSRVSGQVVNLTDYGAFIELEGGVEGLIHVSEMSWTKKVKHPSKILNIGDDVEAVILDVDIDSKRISLGLKQMQTNPWDELSNAFPVGSKVKGAIKNIADFGIFVDLDGEVDALVHITDLDWVQTYEYPAEVFEKGSELEGVVLNIDPQSERFSVGVKQLSDSPWEKITSNYGVGTEVTGKVVRVTGLGTVVEIEAGISGIVPVGAELSGDAGTEVKVKVTDLNEEDRIFKFEVVV